MPPYQSSQASPSGGKNDADRIHNAQLKMQLENRVRIKRGEILDRERRLRDIERDTKEVENVIHHIEQDAKRLNEELRRMNQEVKQGSTIERQEQMNLRDTTQELRRREDLTRKLEHEIDALKQEIAGKEREIAEVKEETRGLMKVKEDHRRTGELEHFSVKSEAEHVHERELKLTMLNQDMVRRQNELTHLKQQYQDLHREINTKEQDLIQIEAELQKVPHQS